MLCQKSTGILTREAAGVEPVALSAPESLNCAFPWLSRGQRLSATSQCLLDSNDTIHELI